MIWVNLCEFMHVYTFIKYNNVLNTINYTYIAGRYNFIQLNWQHLV